jgi:hypothetical protein
LEIGKQQEKDPTLANPARMGHPPISMEILYRAREKTTHP